MFSCFTKGFMKLELINGPCVIPVKEIKKKKKNCPVCSFCGKVIDWDIYLNFEAQATNEVSVKPLFTQERPKHKPYRLIILAFMYQLIKRQHYLVKCELTFVLCFTNL